MNPNPIATVRAVREAANEPAPRTHAGSLQVTPAPLLVHDLYHDFEGLGLLLFSELSRGAWFNAFLLAAGMNQTVEDYLHPDPYRLNKGAGYLSDLRRPLGPLAASAARASAMAIVRMRRLRPSHRRLTAWQAELAALVGQLAEVVIDANPPAGASAALAASAEALLAAPAGKVPSGLRRDVLHLPSCFRSFDQQPADLERVIGDFASRWPGRDRPLVVVGVRTSGSYLAPLYAAYLKRRGYTNVRFLTLRPRRALLWAEQKGLRAVVRDQGLVLLADDPPASGASVAKAADDLKRVGVPAGSIILLLQLFGGPESLPPVLESYASVVLPWAEWSIHAQLTPEAIRSTLSTLADSGEVPEVVERLSLPARRTERSHVRALYRVEWREPATGQRREERVFVKGAGIGYFGEYSLAIVNGLREFLPRVYGYRSGLLYRAWLPARPAVNAGGRAEVETLAVASASYVAARARALATEEDMSLRLSGEGPTWEAASNILSRVFGRLWPALRVLVVDPVTKRLLRVAHPSVVDGDTAPSRWFVDESKRRLLKVNFDDGPFRSDVELTCYDPVYDLASLAAGFDLQHAGVEQLSSRLRREYERLSADSIADERWLLYQLVHLENLQRTGRADQLEVRRALSRAMQRFFAARFFNDLAPAEAGPLVALDIDGVLEGDMLGFPALTPASALALRALLQHGYRTVLATGRSLDEVRERCRAYHLTGGVAEYGAAVYNAITGQSRSLLSDTQLEDLAGLRAALVAGDGIHLDANYRYSVRAYRLDAAGRRRGLPADVIAAAFTRAGVDGRVRAVHGQSQTDFVADGVDKGTGLRALVAEMGGDPNAGKPLALAVGDTASDLPLFALAARAYAPAHADKEMRAAGIERMRRPYQAGLSLAVARLLGHKPGHCPACRAAQPSADGRLLAALLRAPEGGKWSMLRAVLQLAVGGRL